MNFHSGWCPYVEMPEEDRHLARIEL